MRVIRTSLFTALEAETDEQVYPIYGRYRSDVWENLMSDSWEKVYDSSSLEELEAAFWEFMDSLSANLWSALSDWLRHSSLDLEGRNTANEDHC